MSMNSAHEGGPSRDFPPGFLWGTATASYQIEGAATLTDAALPSGTPFADTPGAVWNGDTGDIACDHYHRIDEDLDLLKELGVSALPILRRVAPRPADGHAARQPAQGSTSTGAWSTGCATAASSLPSRCTTGIFPRRSKMTAGGACATPLSATPSTSTSLRAPSGGDVERWITLNEPWCSSWLGYGAGRHAPGRIGHRYGGGGESPPAATPTVSRCPYFARRSRRPKSASPSISGTFSPARRTSLTSRPLAGRTAISIGFFSIRSFAVSTPRTCLSTTATSCRASRSFVTATSRLISQPTRLSRRELLLPLDGGGRDPRRRSARRGLLRRAGEQFPDLRIRSLETPGRDKTAMDWEIQASGLTSLLMRIRDEYTTLPIYITENGAAFDDYVDPNGHVIDHNRVAYLQEHLSAFTTRLTRASTSRATSYGAF